MAKITPIALMMDMVKWVTLLWVRLHTKTRHEKRNKFPSHTWLPYFTPNGRVFKIRDFLCMNSCVILMGHPVRGNPLL